jgi:flagellin-specific chaperone FliS
MQMWENERQITTHEQLTTHNMLMDEAIFELLVERGILTKEELLERIENLRRVTHVITGNSH